MTVQQLDFVFPFVVFGYGAIMVFVLNHPKLMALAQERLPSETFASFQSKRLLSVICFIVGGLWSLQNLWLG